MYNEHICEVCFQVMTSHEERCDYCSTDDETIIHSPALCCPGCPCRSLEEAHPGVDPLSIYDNEEGGW